MVGLLVDAATFPAKIVYISHDVQSWTVCVFNGSIL